MSTNSLIADEVRARLSGDARIPHPAEVAVAERAGTVTLRGAVGSPRQRAAAVHIARSVPGVRAVADELVVDPRDRWEDDEIRGAALQALISNPRIPAERIQVTVANGWLTLRGEVKRQSESNDAFDAVSGLAGVGGVTNRITVITAGIGG